MKNPYYPIDTVVEDIITETPTIKTFCLKPKKPIAFRAGQFMQLTVPGVGEAPFTPSSDPNISEKMEISILKTGKVTDALHELKPGAKVGLRGPFGKGYPLDKLVGKEVLVVGGGVGLAPMRALLYALFNDPSKYKKIVIKFGAREPEELSFRRQYDEWGSLAPNISLQTTIDVPHPKWDGHVGLVTSILDDLDINIPDSYALSCGPEIMLKFVTLKLLEVGYKPPQIYLSMNRKMSCGMGKCGRCNVGHYYLCVDGPDMCYDKIKHVPNVFG
ncbi:MAG: FAD/NAD(P)-binding protein [Candidatus Krumholzibacteriota bacterium]|nr:FAD/NAD(P)-binding protein [Candidatus Krumholzibacteriota bacterium]